jgi:hypothetical protein
VVPRAPSNAPAAVPGRASCLISANDTARNCSRRSITNVTLLKGSFRSRWAGFSQGNNKNIHVILRSIRIINDFVAVDITTKVVDYIWL